MENGIQPRTRLKSTECNEKRDRRTRIDNNSEFIEDGIQRWLHHCPMERDGTSPNCRARRAGKRS